MYPRARVPAGSVPDGHGHGYKILPAGTGTGTNSYPRARCGYKFSPAGSPRVTRSYIAIKFFPNPAQQSSPRNPSQPPGPPQLPKSPTGQSPQAVAARTACPHFATSSVPPSSLLGRSATPNPPRQSPSLPFHRSPPSPARPPSRRRLPPTLPQEAAAQVVRRQR